MTKANQEDASTREDQTAILIDKKADYLYDLNDQALEKALEDYERTLEELTNKEFQAECERFGIVKSETLTDIDPSEENIDSNE